jgi:serine/threonine-protein kinase
MRIVCGICEGLAKAHAAGITHRDIKPANILLNEDLRPVLLDFGLANLQGDERLTQAGSAVGTVAYMSPEQASGREVDSRSDLFSCGIVLYELIAGRTPFRRDNEAATLNAIANASPEPLARYKNDVPDELQRVVTKTLAKSPDERYQTAADLLADLRVIERSLAAGASTSSRRTAASQPSLAVLPFTNMSADPENEYFSDGLTEELLNILAKNRGLKVTGRTSSFVFKGKREDLREIGQKLGVGTILEGSVRKAGNRVRITAQLVNANDGFHLWSETYDRVLDDVFALQDEISRAVAEALNVKLLGESKTHTMDPESYALMLRANHSAQQGSKSSLAVAVDLYRKAIELDPESGRPWAGLGRCLFVQASVGHGEIGPISLEAKEAIARALALDDDLPEAYEALFWIESAFDFQFKEAGEAIRKAQSLAPNNPLVLGAHAVFLAAIQARFEEALTLSRRAVELDPLDPRLHLLLGRVEFWAGENFQAERTLRRVLELSPGFTSASGLLSSVLLLQGRLEEALEVARREESLGYRLTSEAILFHSLARKEESDRALAELLTQGDHWAFQFACTYAWRGEVDEAFEWLEKSYSLRDSGTPLTKVQPLLRNLRDDPRWPGLLKKIGFTG